MIIRMKAIEQLILVVLFILLHSVFVVESEDEILKFDH